MEPIRPIAPRPDLEPVERVILSPRQREERRREREERRGRRARAAGRPADGGEPPRLDVRA